MASRLSFTCEGLDSPRDVARFEGNEAMSKLFAFDITLVCRPEEALMGSLLVGSKGTLTVGGAREPRLVNGIISGLEQEASNDRFVFYRLTLVPRCYRLQLRHDCRIFQQMAVPEIVEQVLAGAGLSREQFRFQLQKSYEARGYCVQYRESDWAFVCRLLEESGIFYYFEHSEDEHVLVMGDSPAADQSIVGSPELKFRANVGLQGENENIVGFRLSEQMRTGRIAVRDFNYENPGLELEATAASDDPEPLELYDYPGQFAAPEAGSTISQRRLEELQATREVGRGQSNVGRLMPGYRFTLTEHPVGATNQEYLVLSVRHQGSEAMEGSTEPGKYENAFAVIPANIPYRPPIVTPKPSPRGVQTAIVVGPAGEEIYTDQLGRVKVQFHWDRLGQLDENSSCWVRVSQTAAGAAFGSLHIPRIGEEVIVDFIEGDPDRPIVTGRVYHGTNVPPYSLPAEKTKSTFKSNSSPGGAGFNELRFEDAAGTEEIFIHGQKDWNIVIQNDKNQTIGKDEKLEVGENRTENIGKDKTISVGENHSESIGKDETIEIGENSAKTVGGDQSLSVSGGSRLTVEGDRTEGVAGKRKLSVDGDNETVFAGNDAFKVEGDRTVDIVGKLTATVGATFTEDIGEEYKLKVGDKLTVTCGSSKIQIDSNGKILLEGEDVTVSSGGPVLVEGSELTVKTDGAVSVDAGGTVAVAGSAVEMN